MVGIIFIQMGLISSYYLSNIVVISMAAFLRLRSVTGYRDYSHYGDDRLV